MSTVTRILLVAGACSLLASAGCRQTDGPENGRSPGASATQDSSPTPGGTPSPPLIRTRPITPNFEFKGDVAPDTKQLIRRTVRRTFALFKIPLPDGEPVEKKVVVYGSPHESKMDHCGELAESGALRIFVTECRQGGTEWLIDTVVHESFHALQSLTIETENPSLQYPVSALPTWFDEGSATLAAAIALDRWGIREYSELRGQAVEIAMRANAELRDLKSARKWNSVPFDQVAAQYALSFLAVEFAAGRDWETTLEVYRRAVSRRVVAWATAFEETFGIAETKFYRRFERYRKAGFRH